MTSNKGEKRLRRPVNMEHFGVEKKKRVSRAAENEGGGAEAGGDCSCAGVGQLTVFRHCRDFKSSCLWHKSIRARKELPVDDGY